MFLSLQLSHSGTAGNANGILFMCVYCLSFKSACCLLLKGKVGFTLFLSLLLFTAGFNSDPL